MLDLFLVAKGEQTNGSVPTLYFGGKSIMLQKLLWSNIPKISKMPIVAPILEWPVIRTIGNYVYINRVLSKSPPPILVYQMGKVGSTSILDSLSANKDLGLIHTHRLSPENIDRCCRDRAKNGWVNKTQARDKQALFVYNKVIKPKYPLNIITLVREPISRNLSAYFQHLDIVWGLKNAHETISFDKLVQGFFDKELHYIPLKWFDYEFKAVLDVDVYQYEFPKELGYLHIRKAPYNILIMKHNLNDKIKEKCIAELLNCNVSLIKRNVGSEKKYGAVYKKFLDNINLPESYLDEMLNNQYVNHFYSSDELAEYKSKWLKRSVIN